MQYRESTFLFLTIFFFLDEVEKYGVNAYKFVLPNNTYDRTESDDCYASNPILANGLSDVSKCFYGSIATQKLLYET